jgi:hypothetical protein
VVVAKLQIGAVVRGAVTVSVTGAGGSLEVQVFAAHSAVFGSGAGRVRVGKLVRHSLHAGKQSFNVSLSAAAGRALRRRGHLSLTVQITVASPTRTAVTVTRSIVLRLHG